MRAIKLKLVFGLAKDTLFAWFQSDAPRLGAALAFYMVFALAPMFVIALALAGFWFGEEAARRELFSQISGLVGRQGGEAIQAVVAAANKPQAGAWATGVALATMFLGATGVFVELQDSLNIVWGVRRELGLSPPARPKPPERGTDKPMAVIPGSLPDGRFRRRHIARIAMSKVLGLAQRITPVS